MSLRFSKSREETGLTLIELLVVIIILGILSGIAVLGLRGAKEASEQRACSVDYESVKSAVKSFQNDWPNDSNITYNELVPDYLEKQPVESAYRIEIGENNAVFIWDRLPAEKMIAKCKDLHRDAAG